MTDKLWSGRFDGKADPLVERFNASVGFDRRLYREDITGSIAHVRMLGHTGIVPVEDAQAIEGGLRDIRHRIEAGGFEWRTCREDVHMNIEAALTDRLGPVAGRLHTARSRNDQVALDMRLYLREAFLDRAAQTLGLARALLDQASGKERIAVPGYTHLQRAQPVSLAHHLHAYVAMLLRDAGRMLDAHNRANRLPLGAGALAGTPHPIDRGQVAVALGFPLLCENSLDAVSDRDPVVELVFAAALCMAHLSRMCEDLVLWMSQEFGYMTLPDALCTGSSIMPQKKNPDVAELVRGKTGRVTGSLVSLLTILKGLPLAYNKDLQEDKEPLFDADDTLSLCLEATTRMVAAASFRADRMADGLRAGFVMATDLADALAEAGVPFRDAHRRVGLVVADCVAQGVQLDDLGEARWAELVPELPYERVRLALDPLESLARRDQPGSPAPARVVLAQADYQDRLEQLAERIEMSRVHTELVDWMRSPSS